MDLKEFYDDREVPDKDRVIAPKNVVLTVPTKDYDIKSALVALGLSRFEVNVLWPKGKLSPEEEALLLHPLLVVQLGKQFSRRFPFVPDGSLPDESLKVRALEATADRYVVLHHHDEFSLQDGLGTAQHLGDLLVEQRRSFMAVTNHGSIGGWIKQHNVCKTLGLKCIFGCEIYVEHYRGDDPEEKKKHRSAFHLVLLARTKEGFDNLIRIHNDAQLNGFYYSPRVNWEAIRKWGKGLVALTACAAGEVPRALMAGDEAKAEEAFKVYSESFDKVYVELQIIEMEEQREINRRLIKFAEKVGAETVISCDSHYLDPTHTETHSLLMYIRQKKTILEARELDADVWDFDVGNLFYRTAAQMEEPFRNGFTTKDRVKRAPFLDDVFTEDVFRRSMAKTRQVALDIEDISLDSKVKLPKLSDDSEKVLREKVNAGFKRLLLHEAPNSQEYKDRVKYEYDVITKLGFADYFLITEKIVKYAKETFGEWTVGFGRGSGAGSVVSWCLGITDVDPIRYDLLFERFLDASRTDMPDLDLDFDPRYRDKVKDYITATFGADNTCSIGTYGSYKTRAVILDIARVLGLDVHEAMELTKSLELTVGVENEETGEEEDYSIDKVDWDELIEQFADLRLYFEKHPEVLFHARVLRNQVKHMGTHAGGVIISDLNLKDRIPVFQDKNGKVVSCWNESGNSTELSSVGLVKFDILGLCLEENTLVETNKGSVPIRDVEGLSIKHLDGQGKVRLLSPEDYLLIYTGEKDLIEIRLDDGSKILCSGDHKFFRHEGQR